jgi:uncharacterized protein (TIGR02231 family)
MKIIITPILLFCCISLSAQPKTSQSVTGTLQSANVYYGYGAELNHTSKAVIGAGLQELVITGIATQVDVNTIQVSCPENIVLMSYQFSTKQEKLPPAAVSKTITDSLQLLQKQLAAINNEYAIQYDVMNRTSKLIESNIGNTPKKEITSAELIKLLDYYTEKIQTIKHSLYALQLKRDQVQETINGINTRLSDPLVQTGTRPKLTGQIVLQLMSKSSTTADISISYFTRNAGWLPTYDLRMKTIDNSFKLTYKASVTQSTGIDWKNVKLHLSTSNPNLGNSMPVINPLFVSVYAPVLYETMKQSAATKKPMRNSASMQEVVGAANGAYELKDEDVAREPATVAAFTSLTESQLNTTFEIDLPYDIPADGRAYTVFIKEEQLKAGYKHFTVPKLDRDAFMMAELTDWQTLDLLPGEANIIMDNVYLGKSTINPNTTTDTLRLSLGRDKRVATTRTLVKEFSKSKLRGDTKVETFTYEINLRNNKKQAIDIEVNDQIPVSKLKEVEVGLDDNGNAEVNAETGVLTWKLKLQPGESKKLRFSYHIQYPKDKILQNGR